MKEPTVVQIVKRTIPAVVSIVISKDLPKIEGFYRMPIRGRNYIIPKFKKGEIETQKIGGGSGFFVSANGLLLTNSHVVQDPHAKYTVIMDGKINETQEMKVLARDPIHDIAICKVEGEGYPYLEFGDSNKLELGESVIAVGNALGEFANTVSLGIVSGLSRFIQAQTENMRHAERLRGLIQTDAAINPGNSGGPLVNMQSKVVGLNTATVFGAQSIGFSIPITHAKHDLEEIKKYGRIRTPFIGVRYMILDKTMREHNKFPVDYGALVMREELDETAVIPGSSAHDAGIQELDIILEAEGKKITPEFSLQDILAEHEVGDKIKLKILRDGHENDVELELEEKKK